MCWHREDNTQPTYTWNRIPINIAGTTVRYYSPAGALGLVMLFDGGGGGNVWFRDMENRLQVEALVDAGFAVAALESAGSGGDFDMNPDYAANQDLKNVDGTIASTISAFPRAEPLPASPPSRLRRRRSLSSTSEASNPPT
jgi:hypothetical protein